MQKFNLFITLMVVVAGLVQADDDYQLTIVGTKEWNFQCKSADSKSDGFVTSLVNGTGKTDKNGAVTVEFRGKKDALLRKWPINRNYKL